MLKRFRFSKKKILAETGGENKSINLSKKFNCTTAVDREGGRNVRCKKIVKVKVIDLLII